MPYLYLSLPGGVVVKKLSANTGVSKDMDLILGSGRPPRVVNGNPLQYSCLQNSTDRGAWRNLWDRKESDMKTHTHIFVPRILL